MLISDGGQHIEPMRRVLTFWPVQLGRVLDVINNQVRALRKRQVIDSYGTNGRGGAYWGIETDIAHYPTPGPLAGQSLTIRQC